MKSRLITWRRPEVKFDRNVVKKKQHKNYQDEDNNSAINEKLILRFLFVFIYIYIYISKGLGPLRDFYFSRIIYFVLTYVDVSCLLLTSDNIWMGHPVRPKLIRVVLFVECFFRFWIDLYRGHCVVLYFPSSSSSLSFSLSVSTGLSCPVGYITLISLRYLICYKVLCCAVCVCV